MIKKKTIESVNKSVGSTAMQSYSHFNNSGGAAAGGGASLSTMKTQVLNVLNSRTGGDSTLKDSQSILHTDVNRLKKELIDTEKAINMMTSLQLNQSQNLDIQIDKTIPQTNAHSSIQNNIGYQNT